MKRFYNIEEQRKWNYEEMWTNDGHEWSKSFGTTENLWNVYIFDTIKQFRNKRILEIAPGYGRMTQFLSILASQLIVIDLNARCIEKTREKLGHHIHEYFVNDGKSLTGIGDNTQNLVFSFDSFVHFHKNVTEEYIKEIRRVLKPGGYGFIHHSWVYKASDYSFNNIGGRANMSPEEFRGIVESNNMRIISQKEIQFDGDEHWPGKDCISFFMKPEQ